MIERKDKMKAKNLLSCLDPLFYYIVAIYGLSRVYQYVYDIESVWQTSWEQIQEILGERKLQEALGNWLIVNCRR